MSFASQETSIDSGEPIDLYVFTYGAGPTDFFAYTDAEDDFTWLGVEVFARQIEHDDIQSSGTTDKTTMEIRMLNTDPVAEMFRVYPPSFPISVIIYRGHVGSDDFLLQWSGKVLSCARDGALQARLTCEPSTISLRRIGLRRSFQYMCPFPLYGAECKANKAAATITVIPSVVESRKIVLDTVIANPPHYAGGIVEWVNTEGRTEYRTVLTVDVVGSTTELVVSGITRGLAVGDMFLLSKGCAHNMTACSTVHNNILNYGGQPYIPTKNPLGRTTPFL